MDGAAKRREDCGVDPNLKVELLEPVLCKGFPRSDTMENTI
jgi:hypothetical protein